jgi:hypothetical protein
MPAIRSENGYSADVRLHLEFDGVVARIAQVGSDFLILRDNCEAPAGTVATVVVSVDGNAIRYPVLLSDGIVRNVQQVDFVDLEDCKLAETGRAHGR